MNKIKKVISSVIVTGLALYVGFFFVWVALTASCLEASDIKGEDWEQCGDNKMTDYVRVLYGPLVNR